MTTFGEEVSQAARDRAASLVGRVVGERFRIEALVAMGGLAAVFRARHLGSGEVVAIKVMNPEAAALPEPLVHIRRHEANVSRDLVPRLLDEIATLQHAMDNHPEAVAYHPIIHDEIGIRTKNAFHAAFAGKDHVMAAALFEKLPPEWRSAKARVKNIVARMPDCLGRRLNTSLQALVSKQARDPGEG